MCPLGWQLSTQANTGNYTYDFANVTSIQLVCVLDEKCLKSGAKRCMLKKSNFIKNKLRNGYSLINFPKYIQNSQLSTEYLCKNTGICYVSISMC